MHRDETPQGPPTRVPRWGLGDALVGFLVGILLSSIVASAWAAASGTRDLSLGGQALSQLGLWVGIGGVPLLVSRYKGAGTPAEDFGFRVRAPDLLAGLVAGVLAQVVLVRVVALLLEPLVGHPDVSQRVREITDKAHGGGFLGLAVVVVVGAPVVEELFFRGLVLRSLQRRFGDVWAVAGSSLAFGLAHVGDQSADAVVVLVATLAAFGALLAVLAVRTGRLGPGILAHATFNGLTVAYIALRR